MRRARTRRWAVAAFGTIALAAGPQVVSAQSFLAAEGLGTWVESLDGRTRALGGAGVGLEGWYVSESDPAASAGLLLPSAGLTFQATNATLTDDSDAGYTRFPNAGASYAYRGNVVSVLFGSAFDQEWEANVRRTISLGGEDVDVLDIFTSKGGIGRVRVGWARVLPWSLAVGVNVGTHIGSVERLFSRQLDPEDVGPDVEPHLSGSRYRASGLVATVGAAWDPSPLLRVAGSVSFADDLLLKPTTDEQEEKRYALPMELRAGGTISLTEQFRLHAGISYADWSTTADDLQPGSEALSTWSYGGGVEWSSLALFDRPMPLRLGARSRDLPFAYEGDAVQERFLTGGIGLNLLETETQPLARFDLGAEWGSRSGGSLSEDFWKLVFSVRVASS